MSSTISKSEIRRAHRRHFMRRAIIGRRVRFAVIAAVALVAVVAAWGWWPQARLATAGTVATYKSPTCQCCTKWVTRMQEHGFLVNVHSQSDVTPVKRAHGVPDALASCHTSVVDHYVFEGHVPPDLVERVLRERPPIAGLAVPGMPQGAPGMDVGAEPYDVMSFTTTGETAVYARR